MKFAVCNEIFQGWDLPRAMSFSAQLGYGGIELAPFTLAKRVTDIPLTERQEIKNIAADVGIEICGLHWLLAKTEGLYLNHSDADIRNATREYFCELVDCCADLGGKIMVLGSPQQRNILPGFTREQAEDLAQETLRDAVKRAEDRGIVICFEPLSPAETNFINTAAEAIAFADRFNSPAMKIILDVKAMSSEGTPIDEIIRQSEGEFFHFHANDKNLKGPGFGEIDFNPIGIALKQVAYEGWISVEVFDFSEGPEIIASKSLEYLKRTIG